MEQAETFYDKFLAIIGFDISKKVSAIIQEHDLYVVEYLLIFLPFPYLTYQKQKV